jgi:DNA-binding SARP family transcriptional activator/tetratricopeptide (TPR) repeat protein
MMKVFVLGEQRIADSGAALQAPASRSFELLAYLALHAGVEVSRQYLAGLFWPDSSAQQSLTNLRRELHQLRAMLDGGGGLRIGRTFLSWTDTPGCRVDACIFRHESAAAGAAAAAGDRDGFLAHAQNAIDEYRGELLPGTFVDWVLEQRDELRGECVQLCDRAGAAWRKAGDLQRAASLARRRVRLEPLEESGYRALMELQAALGDRGAAMTTFHHCAAVLEQELGVRPDPRTNALMERLLGPADGPGPARGKARAAGRGQILVGRRHEVAQLEARWQQALDQEPGLLLLTGDAGVGKSRLAGELMTLARTSGATVAQSRCFSRSGRIPLAPVVDWLRHPGLAASLPALPAVWRAEVNRLLPELADGLAGVQTAGLPDRPAASPGSGQQPPATSRAMVDAWQRHRFFEGLARAVLVSGRPVLLVLDDLHWVDAETMSWLAFLIGYARQARLLVVATARSQELEQASDLAEVLRPLASSGFVTALRLDPLSEQETAELAASVTGRRPDAAGSELLYAATGGYPIYIVEAARMLLEEGGDRQHGLTDLASVLQRRLEQASDAARAVAGLAAAYGQDVSLDLLDEAGDLDMQGLVTAVDELWRLRILRTQGRGYDFAHDLLREAAYQSVTPARRWLLHSRLAQALEVLNAGQLDDVAAQLGEQYSLAGRGQRALQHYRRAGEVAVGVFANMEALRYYRHCRDIIAGLPAGEHRSRRELEVLLAMSAPLTARHGYSSPELQTTLERTAELGQQLNEPKVLISALIGLFSSRFVQGEMDVAFRTAERALTLAQLDPDLLGQAHFAYAGAALGLGRPLDSIEHFGRAVELSLDRYSYILGTKLEVHARAWSAHAHWLAGDDDAAVRLCRDAVDRGREAGHPYSLAIALAYASVLHQLRHDGEALAAAARELQELCKRYEFAYYGQWAAILMGWHEGGQSGAEAIRTGIRTLRSQRALARMPYWLSLLAETRLGYGQLDKAEAALDAALAAAEQHGDRWWLPEVLRLRSLMADGGRAADLLARARSLALAQDSPPLAARCDATELPGTANAARTVSS